MTSPPTSPERAQLSAFDAAMLTMGGIIGVGIFFTPASVAELVPHAGAYLGLWAFGALFALSGALTFGELGANIPRTGGWYVYLREAFGPFVAFLFAWIILGVATTGALAVIADFCASSILGLGAGEVAESSRTRFWIGATVLIGLSLLAMRGFKLGATVQNICMVTKLVAITALIAAGLAFALPVEQVAEVEAAATAVPDAGAGSLWKGLLAAALPVLFTYGGWQNACYIAPEVHDARRTLPRSLLIGVAGVAIIYLLVNLAIVRAFGIQGLAGNFGFASTLAERAFGPAGARALQAAMAVSALGVCAVNVIAVPGVYVAMAREGLFFKSFGRVHARLGTPMLAIGAECVVALAYLAWMHAESLFGATASSAEAGGLDVNVLLGSVTFAEGTFHGLVAIALIRFRSRRDGFERLGRGAIGRAAPWFYLAVSAAIVLGNLAPYPGPRERIGLIALAVGALVYWPWRMWLGRARRRTPGSEE